MTVDQEREPRAVVAGWIDAFAAGDAEGLLGRLAEDVVWIVPGDLPVSGRYAGKPSVVEMLANSAQLLDASTVSLRVASVLADGSRCAAEWTVSGETPAGSRYENEYALFFEVAGGLIAEIREYTDTERARGVLFG